MGNNDDSPDVAAPADDAVHPSPAQTAPVLRYRFAATDDHWFDRLHKASIAVVSRRSILGAVGIVASSRFFGSPVTAARKRKPKKRKKKDNPQAQAPSCSGGACARVWAGNDNQIAYCEFVCRQCDDDDPRHFCIADSATPDGTPTKEARCCPAGEGCCQGLCCGSSTNPWVRCCGGKCVDTSLHRDHCGGCHQPCNPGDVCVAGGCACGDDSASELRLEGGACLGNSCHEACAGPTLACCDGDCVNIMVDEENCGGCARQCIGAGIQCCDGDCVDPLTDQNHCGGCGGPCSGIGGGWRCCNGECKNTNRDEEHCGGCGETCSGPGLQCCDGGCVDTRTDPDHCSDCFRNNPGFLCCGGHLYDPTQQYCCPDGLRPCFNSQICCMNAAGIPACCPPP